MFTVEIKKEIEGEVFRKIFPAEAIVVKGNQITMTTNRHKKNENHITYTISDALWQNAIIYNGSDVIRTFNPKTIYNA